MFVMTMPRIIPENKTKIGLALAIDTQSSSLLDSYDDNISSASNISHAASATSYANLEPTHLNNTTGFDTSTTALEQYRLHLYNYALHMERLRYTPQDHNVQHQRQHHYNIITNSSGCGYTRPTYIPSNRLALSMSLFPQHIFKPEDPKPQHSYIGLIAMAILNSSELKLVLSDIYQYILDNYPYFRSRGPGWRNSIRHNLSLNDCFVKSGRSANGKGHYWAIHPANMEDFRKGDFRRRKAQRKVRKHMGLSVDDAGTDSPSPPPLDLSSPPPSSTTLLHNSTSSFNVAQQLAAFGYIQQCSHPLSITTPAFNNYSFRPIAARYYIATPSVSLGCESAKSNQQECTTSKASGATTTASVIANLYSQSRKRQFDMASLLEPDAESVTDHKSALRETTTTTTTTTRLDVDEKLSAGIRPVSRGVRTTQLQHTVITKFTMNQRNHHMNATAGETYPDDQNEDIDVVDVASDGEINSDDHILGYPYDRYEEDYQEDHKNKIIDEKITEVHDNLRTLISKQILNA